MCAITYVYCSANCKSSKSFRCQKNENRSTHRGKAHLKMKVYTFHSLDSCFRWDNYRAHGFHFYCHFRMRRVSLLLLMGNTIAVCILSIFFRSSCFKSATHSNSHFLTRILPLLNQQCWHSTETNTFSRWI